MTNDEVQALVKRLLCKTRFDRGIKEFLDERTEAAAMLTALSAEVERQIADIQAMLLVHANDKAERELHQRAYESTANDLDYCRAERDQAHADLAEAVGLMRLIAETPNAGWMIARAFIAKHKGE